MSEAAFFTAIKTIYEDIKDQPPLSVMSAQCLVSPAFWVPLILEDKVNRDDIITKRRTEGQYIVSLRQQLTDFYPSVFGNGSNSDLLTKYAQRFKTVALNFLTMQSAFEAKRKKADEKMDAFEVLSELRDAIEDAKAVISDIMYAHLEKHGGASVAKSFKDNTTVFKATLFPAGQADALTKATKEMKKRDRSTSPPGGRRPSGGGPTGGRQKKRKCKFCKAGPFKAGAEMMEHNKVCPNKPKVK